MTIIKNTHPVHWLWRCADTAPRTAHPDRCRTARGSGFSRVCCQTIVILEFQKKHIMTLATNSDMYWHVIFSFHCWNGYLLQGWSYSSKVMKEPQSKALRSHGTAFTASTTEWLWAFQGSLAPLSVALSMATSECSYRFVLRHQWNGWQVKVTETFRV